METVDFTDLINADTTVSEGLSSVETKQRRGRRVK